MEFKIDEQLYKDALDYHELPISGKIEVVSTKPVTTQRDLSLAYSPGVAAPCLEIEKNPLDVYKYTNKGNLVAVISNGTAVLGLGNIGALASKPVMEGKGILFKKFAGIDVYDLELNVTDINVFVEAVAALEPTFGGINLEDIKAPECFIIEKKLKERMNIPVFHDDQHGTAIVVAAGIINALKIVNKKLNALKIVVSGAGAAGIACLDLLCSLGALKNNIYLSDSKGIVHSLRTGLDTSKMKYAQKHDCSVEYAFTDADVFLGVSGPNTVSQDMIKIMANNPIVFALANPTPEIMPELVSAVRPDAIIATGRSDYPNQINNALCFPYIFRGALDVGATTINEEMKVAAVYALAELVTLEPNEIVSKAYIGEDLTFGRDYIIPKPLDPRLIQVVAPAVAKAGVKSGVATRPIHDWDMYDKQLNRYVYKSSMFMTPIIESAKQKQARIVLCEGEDERVLLAVSAIKELKIAKPIIIGRQYVIEQRIKKLALKIVPGIDFELVNIENDQRYRSLWQQYHQMMIRKGVVEETARHFMMTNQTLIGAMLVLNGDADGMVCGLTGKYKSHLDIIKDVIGSNEILASMNVLLLQNGNLFIADTQVNEDPTAEELAKITIISANSMMDFGIVPKIALLSSSNYGQADSKSAEKMRSVLSIVNKENPSLMIDGEMHGDTALIPAIRNKILPNSPLIGSANLLIMPNLDSANIAYNLLRVSSSNGITIGPILLGAKRSVHILTSISTVRRVVNMVAVAATMVNNVS